MWEAEEKESGGGRAKTKGKKVRRFFGLGKRATRYERFSGELKFWSLVEKKRMDKGGRVQSGDEDEGTGTESRIEKCLEKNSAHEKIKENELLLRGKGRPKGGRRFKNRKKKKEGKETRAQRKGEKV